MKEIVKQDQDVVSNENQDQALSNFKAAFYMMNAKPDSSIQLLDEIRKIDLGSIRDLNERVQRKLENHDIVGQIAAINLQFKKGKILDYNTWDEFLRENFRTINKETKAINIEWDILIKLPKYQNPQRHTIKVKIGNSISPQEMMQVMWTEENPTKLSEMFSNGLIRVDFIDQVLASELINLIQNWHSGQPKILERNGFQKFISKNNNRITNLISQFVPVIFLLIFYYYFNSFCEWGNTNSTLTLSNIQILAIIFLSIFILGKFIGAFIGRLFKKSLDKFRYYPGFEITKGDTLAVDEYLSLNKEATRGFINKVVIGIISGIVVVGLKYLIKYLVG